MLRPFLIIFVFALSCGVLLLLDYEQLLSFSMTKTKRPQASPLEAFHAHFSVASRYGERWQHSLYPALAEGTRYTALWNRYTPRKDFDEAIGSSNTLERVSFPSAAGDIQAENLACFVRKNDTDHRDAPFPQPEKASNGLLTHWNLDAASALAVHVLRVEPSDRVLDLCAAPGGKSLALAQSIWPHLQPDYPGPALPPAKKGALHSNEFDGPRNKRLAENLAAYLPASVAQSGQQKVLRLDGTKGASVFPLGPGGYDKVLVDAPCSSERHIIHAQAKAPSGRITDELSRWSPTSSKRMAETQVQLLLSAMRAVRIGGSVLYATCSISNEENDGVVEKALTQLGKDKAKGAIRWSAEMLALGDEVEKQLQDWAEKTGKGWIVLPDHAGGARWGPLYFTVLTKTQSM